MLIRVSKWKICVRHHNVLCAIGDRCGDSGGNCDVKPRCGARHDVRTYFFRPIRNVISVTNDVFGPVSGCAKNNSRTITGELLALVGIEHVRESPLGNIE